MALPNEVDPMETGTTAQAAPAPADDPSPATDAPAEPQAPQQGFDEDFLKKLDALDPTTLPQSFHEKFVPKSEFTKKTQALAEERKQLETERQSMFETFRKVIEQRQSPSGPTAEETRLKELSELAAAGDSTAQMQLADLLAERKIAPLRTQMTLQTAAQNARTAKDVGPYVQENWTNVIQEITNSPLLGRLASADNHAGAQAVMEALGYRYGFNDRGAKLEVAQRENEALKAKLATYERERTAGLPSSTTRAGTTAGRAAAQSEPTEIADIALKAWLESGGTPESYR